MLEALNAFFTTFKAAVFVPVFIFVIALAMGVKPKKAFFSALSAGVGLEGFSPRHWHLQPHPVPDH